MEKKTCNNCEGVKLKPPATVDYFVYDDTVSRYERTVKKLWIALIVLASMFFASNSGWLIYESQFVEVSYEQDGDGLNNVNLGEQGDLKHGAETKDQTQTQE